MDHSLIVAQCQQKWSYTSGKRASRFNVIEFEKCTDVALALAFHLAQPFTRIANAVTRQSAGADTATDILRLRLKHLAVLLNTSKT